MSLYTDDINMHPSHSEQAITRCRDVGVLPYEIVKNNKSPECIRSYLCIFLLWPGIQASANIFHLFTHCRTIHRFSHK